MASRNSSPTTDTTNRPAYRQLLLFNGEGDCLAAKLRPGNVHDAGAARFRDGVESNGRSRSRTTPSKSIT
jgi:hypothetical protein